MITYCPNGHRVETSADQLGSQTRCPTCNVSFVVAESTSATTAEPSRTDHRERAPGVAPRREHAADDRWADRFNLDVLETLRPAAQLMLLIGLLLAFLAHGWDSTGDRNAKAAQARVDHAVNEWNDKWEDRLDRIEEEEKTLRAQQDLTADDYGV